MKVTFFHGSHNTDVTVYAKDGELTPRQIVKVERELCGMADCSCFLYPIYGKTADEATAVLTKDGELSVYREVELAYDIENLPYVSRGDFCAEVDRLSEAVQGSYSMRGKYTAVINCPVGGYEWLLEELQDSCLTVVK
jgi:hypothetical protein